MGSMGTCNSCETEKLIFNYSDINEDDLYQNHHDIKGARILFLNKLSSKEIYSILIPKTVNKPTSNIYLKNCLKIQLLIDLKFTCYRLATIDATLRSFQHEILKNVLFLNKKTMHSWDYKYCTLLFL